MNKSNNVNTLRLLKNFNLTRFDMIKLQITTEIKEDLQSAIREFDGVI